MNSRALVVLAALLLCAAVGVMSCSKSTSPKPVPPSATTFDLRFPANGTSQFFRFMTPGTYDYLCTPHRLSGMIGTVIVSDAAGADSDTVAVGVDGSGTEALLFTPSTVTIKTNGRVRWINRSSMLTHTVTYP
jgi:plastocyanin